MKIMVFTVTAVVALAYAASGQNEFGLGAGNGTLTGGENTGIGYQALLSITSGHENTAEGFQALNSNTSGSGNTANGLAALRFNTTGHDNTAIGYVALPGNTTGGGNIALGFQAGYNLTTGDNNIDIGNGGVAGEGGTIRIGAQGTHTNTFIAGISGVSVPGSSLVAIDANGQLGTTNIATANIVAAAWPQGAYLTLPHGTVAPAGFTFVGTTSMKYKYEVGSKHKNKTVTFDLYQKD